MSGSMKVIVLVSGRMDSVAALHHARTEHHIVGTLSFDYGSKHNHREIPFARVHSDVLEVPHTVIALKFMAEHFQSDLLQTSLGGSR
jgi:7-cyano-7-deazaguanine synthase